jgi:perosamine synthetase
MVFNSLGSNYDFKFVLKSLFSIGKKNDHQSLTSFLEKKHDGKTILLYKGREAIKLALTILDLPKGSKIGVTGFTCFAVYQAVVETGCVCEFIDIKGGTLNFGLEELQKHKGLKALIVQNTLGIPSDMTDIKTYCGKNNIFLIEDLAHSIGTVYENDKEAGTMGDFTTLSFSQDKAIDAISGGALIVRNETYQNKIGDIQYKGVGIRTQAIDRLYPLFTYIIRNTYRIGLGKLLHRFVKTNGLLSKSMPEGKIYFHRLPNWYCTLIINQFSELTDVLKHRKKIISIYESKFKIGTLGMLRYPIFIQNRIDLIKYLKANSIYVSDIWYDAPVSPIKYMSLTNYSGNCPISENVSKMIINLPTHINISTKEAERLSALVNTWLNTNQK